MQKDFRSHFRCHLLQEAFPAVSAPVLLFSQYLPPSGWSRCTSIHLTVSPTRMQLLGQGLCLFTDLSSGPRAVLGPLEVLCQRILNQCRNRVCSLQQWFPNVEVYQSSRALPHRDDLGPAPENGIWWVWTGSSSRSGEHHALRNTGPKQRAQSTAGWVLSCGCGPVLPVLGGLERQLCNRSCLGPSEWAAGASLMAQWYRICLPCRRPGLIPGLGRSRGERHGNPLQYSCLENPHRQNSLWATVQRVAKSRTRLSD